MIILFLNVKSYLPFDIDLSADPYTVGLNVDWNIIGALQDLERYFSKMMVDTRKDLKGCDIEELTLYLDDLFEVDEFRKCKNIDEVLRKLRCDHIDIFNIRYLEHLVSRFHQDEVIVKAIEEYEEKKEQFLGSIAVKEFQQAFVSRAETAISRGMATVRIGIPKEYSSRRTMKYVEVLAKKALNGRNKDLIRILVIPGGVHDGSLSSKEEMMGLQQKGENIG